MCLAALVVTSTAAGVHSTEARADAAALASYDDAVVVLTGARTDADQASADLDATRATATDAADAATSALEVVDPELLDDTATVEALEAARDELATADEVIDGYLAETASDPDDDLGAAPATRDEHASAAVRLIVRAGVLDTAAGTMRDFDASLAELTAAVDGAALDLAASAHAHGTATDAPELAGDEATDAYAAAVGALDGVAASDLAPALSAYQDAWADAVAAHEAAEEAARAAAEASAPPPAANTSDGVQPTYIRGILVVNKTYGLPSWYGNGLTAETVNAYERMRAEAAAFGLDLYISSGFRSYATQASIYNRYVANEGVAAADRHSARPGHSEHQTGLTFDLNTITEAFGRTAEGQWVAQNAHRFGFIVRYPPGKEAITGYVWEPWHLRYLGVGTASEVYASGLSLEEYLGITSVYR
ncbi:hypothetical protein GCM10025877_05650 [Agromyces mangrovi Wang et al. 2018]|nr:hypothetical protein GCM10025877_05650 [Agromyces mangrovi]